MATHTKLLSFHLLFICFVPLIHSSERSMFDAESNLRYQRAKAYEQWDEKYQDWQNCGCPESGKYSVMQKIFSKKWVKDCEQKRKEIQKIGKQIQEIDAELHKS